MIKTIALFLALSFSLSSFAEIEITNEDTSETYVTSDKATVRLNYYFGSVPVSAAASTNYFITNKSDAPITLTRFESTSPAFQGSFDCRVLQPKQRCGLSIRFWPAFAGQHYGTLYLELDRHDLFIFDLSGRAY